MGSFDIEEEYGLVQTSKWKKNILQALHASGIGAHSGITATYHRIKALFAWTGIFQSVESFVNKCKICQQAKVEH